MVLNKDFERGIVHFQNDPDALAKWEAVRAFVASIPNFPDLPLPPEEIDPKILVMNLEKREITLYGTVIPLSPDEFHVFRILVKNRGQLVLYSVFMKQIFGSTDNYKDHLQSIRVFVHKIRGKLKKSGVDPLIIQTRHKSFADDESGYTLNL